MLCVYLDLDSVFRWVHGFVTESGRKTRKLHKDQDERFKNQEERTIQDEIEAGTRKESIWRKTRKVGNTLWQAWNAPDKKPQSTQQSINKKTEAP